MPWTVYNSDGKILQSAEVGNNSITNAKMADDAIDSAEIADGAIDLVHMSSQSVDEDNLYISNAGNNGEFLSKQSGNNGGLTWAAAGGAVTREGGNTTEATSTATSTVDVLTSSTTSVAVGEYLHAMATTRKTTGASTSAFNGCKFNSTTTRTAFSFHSNDNTEREGTWQVFTIVGTAGYLRSGQVISYAEEIQDMVRNFNGDMPTATITSVTVTGGVNNSSATFGADNLHVYSLAVS